LLSVGLLIHQLLLLASIAALGAAGWRLTAPATPAGLMRVLGAVTLAAAGAILCSFALALVALGGSPVALTAAAIALWLIAWRVVPGRPPSAFGQLWEWWSLLSTPGRVARLAVTGAAAGYGVWVLRYPGLGFDALTYHLAFPVAWIQNGRPGSLVWVWDGLPLQNYPLTWEVLVTWVTAIARTFVPATLMTPATLLLLGASVRGGLGQLGVSPRTSWLATATATTLPIAVVQLPGPNNDLPEMAWLACAAALAAGAAAGREDAERRGALLAVALVAAGLCLGIKTTGAPLAALVIILGAWRCRHALRRLALPLGLAVAVAAVVGGFWYARNLVEHGAPFWPRSTNPFGDAIPEAFRVGNASLLSDLHATLHGRIEEYWQVIAGGAVAFVAALISPLWARRREVMWGAVVVLVALLLWAAEPSTGDAGSTALAVGATRYLLPCLLAAVVVVALSGRGSGRAELLPAAALLGALAVNLYYDAELAFPYVPSARLLVLAAGLGGLAGLGAELLLTRLTLDRWGAPAAAAGLGAVLLVALLVPVNGYLADHAKTDQFDAGLVRWLDARPAFRNGHDPVLVGPISVAVLTGARLTHRLTVLPGDDRCPALARQAREAWVVMEVGAGDFRYDKHWITCLPGRHPTLIDETFLVYPPTD
jgi:hypothetical protein